MSPLREYSWDARIKVGCAMMLIALVVLLLMATGALIGRYTLLEQLQDNCSTEVVSH